MSKLIEDFAKAVFDDDHPPQMFRGHSRCTDVKRWMTEHSFAGDRRIGGPLVISGMPRFIRIVSLDLLSDIGGIGA
jgi:hypothetical protein